MKRIISLSILLLTTVIVSAVKKSDLKVLYVGGHADIETFDEEAYDTVAVEKSVAERTAAWKAYLEEYFAEVGVVQGSDYSHEMSEKYDVTIIDGDPKPMEPRKTLVEGGRYKKFVEARYFPDNFDCPVITIAEESEKVGRRIGVKNDWYCLCLDAHAYGMNTKHEIFKGPYPVTLTMTDRKTPDGAKEYAAITGETLPETTPMWRVQNKGYLTDRMFKVGMVTRPWGYNDSPDTEVISGGESAKSYDAIAIGRHANWLHWGFAASPADMTVEARAVFANAVVYISKFAGRHIIARKLNQSISTRNDAQEKKRLVSREVYDSYVESTKKFNADFKQYADSLKQVQAAGGKLTDTDKQYIMMAEHPQPIPEYADYVKQRAGDLYDKFGTDVSQYEKYYDENIPYFYGNLDDYGLALDEDAKSLGITNSDKRLIDKAISLWESGEDVAKAKRILYRYTLLRYDDVKQWRKWYDKYRKKLFFTESGGWLWLVDDQDPATPGNDYSVLKRDEISESEMAQVKAQTTKEDPVQASCAINSSGDERELVIRLKIHPGYHIYSVVSEKDPYIQTTFELKAEGCQTVGELQKPGGRILDSNGSIVWENEVVLKQKIKGKYGKVSCSITYQACDNHACLMPTTKTVEAMF